MSRANCGKIDVNALKSLLPQAVIEFAMTQKELKPPLRQSFDTVAMFADVSGFTKLSESFASKGPQGAEELAFFLNRYMEQLVRHIARAGGDVFKFAGDAMLVLWVPSETDEEISSEVVKSMAHRAVQCSIAIQQELDSAELTKGVSLSVKIGIGVGRATVLHVGGVYGRVEYFACGVPLMQAFESEGHAQKGDIIASPQTWDLIQDSFVGENTGDGFVRVTRQSRIIKNRSVKSKSKPLSTNSSRDYLRLLECYIPAAVLPYLTQNAQKTWAGELRMVSVLFVNIGVNLSTVQTLDATSLNWIQDVILSIQKGVYKYEGSLNKFLVDDKGSNVIAVFGVPPLAHYDDATRAVLSALKLFTKMKSIGIKCFIGVTSGLVYTGLLGSGTSREYGVLGDAVNLAARLMAKQKKSGIPGVLIDHATQELIPTWAPIQFEPLEPFYVKGKNELIEASVPRYTEQNIVHKPDGIQYFNIGRETQVQEVETAYRISCNQERGYVLLVESPIGTGKSYFLESLAHRLSRNKAEVRTIWARAFQYIHNFVWSVIFGELLQREQFTEQRSYRAHVKAIFETEPECVPYLSLANELFGTQFMETEKVALLANEEERFERQSELCLHILKHFSKERKLILFLDNLQWMTSNDWHVTEFICNLIVTSKQLPRVHVFLASRPIMSALFRPRFIEPPPQYRRIRHMLKEKRQIIQVRSWDLFEVKSFVCEYFAVDDVQPSLASFITERTGGNPAFCLWICELIDVHISHENGVMLLELADEASSAVHSEAPLQHAVPIKVHSTLIGYIDRLTPSQILLLKTASAICMGQGSGSILFDVNTVRDCYPVDDYQPLIDKDLKYLAQIGIIKLHTSITYDTHTARPNIFPHNYQWMYSSTFLTAVFDVAQTRTSDDAHFIYSSRLVHFFKNRLEIFPFYAEKGADWRVRKVIPFNQRDKQVTLRRPSVDILSVEYDDRTWNFRGQEECIEKWYDALDTCLSEGVMTETQESDLTVKLEADNQLYGFSSGFFRDVIYGLMLLKQRQALHDNCHKFISNRWQGFNDMHDGDIPEETDGSDEPRQMHLTKFQQNLLSRHKDLALKDDSVRRMGSFYQAAPQNFNKDRNSMVATGSSQKRQKSLASPVRYRNTLAHQRSTLSPKRRSTRVSHLSPTKRGPSGKQNVIGRIRESLLNVRS